jgi:poly-beta-1,6-N-acetyl-D-glucosamine synthase
MRALFWTSLALIVYAYAGYPCILAFVARLRPRAVRKRPVTDQATAPGISIILAARNEARRLPDRLENLLRLAYPGPRQIIVVSDGSTDETARVVARFPGVDFIEIPASGKAVALNAGVMRARHELLVFADARQTFGADTLLELAANFADPEVGGVTGELVLDCEQSAGPQPSSNVAEGVGLYWRYEKWLRRQERVVHSTLGATGAIYALRRALWQPLPAGTLLDDVLAPMRVVLGGRRVVFEERARAEDRVADDGREEQRRKVRTVAGNYQNLQLGPRLLSPFANPVWLQYMSHKVAVRLLVPFALIVLIASNAALVNDGPVYALVLAGQAIFYSLAAFGALFGAATRAARVAYAFVVMNAAGVQALFAVASGRTRWR